MPRRECFFFFFTSRFSTTGSLSLYIIKLVFIFPIFRRRPSFLHTRLFRNVRIALLFRERAQNENPKNERSSPRFLPLSASFRPFDSSSIFSFLLFFFFSRLFRDFFELIFSNDFFHGQSISDASSKHPFRDIRRALDNSLEYAWIVYLYILYPVIINFIIVVRFVYAA